MKRQLLTIILLLFNLITIAQYDFGYKVNIGLSKISLMPKPELSNYYIQFAPSGQAGIFGQMQFRDKSIIGAELNFIQIKGKEKDKGEIEVDGNFGHYQMNSWKNISYLGLPIFYGFKLNKLTINLGFQMSVVLHTNGGNEVKGIFKGESIDSKTNYGKLAIDKYDFGPRAGLFYELSEKLSIEGNYYYGINDITSSSYPRQWKVQQMTIGLRYKFKTQDKTIEN